jgi:large subunit ribosomal protein L6
MVKKYLIKIPKNVSIIYDSKKKLLVLIGSVKTEIITLKLKINIKNNLNSIEITSEFFDLVSNYNKKNTKALQGTTVSLIKQVLLQISCVVYRKLKFVGVGYRAFPVNGLGDKVIMFKLGYSHPVYFKISDKLKIFCLKFTKLFVYGNSYQNVFQTASQIRLCKSPEPYKGKGILYENEKIILKEGKKV